MKNISLIAVAALVGMAFSCGPADVEAAKEIIHDADYYVLEAQHKDQWAQDDKTVDQKLAEFRKSNGGKSPNILYILIDDIGFGDLGIPELNAIRGYKTPHINKFADESMRFARVYRAFVHAHPCCFHDGTPAIS